MIAVPTTAGTGSEVTPVAVVGLSGVTQLDAGDYHSCAVVTSGAIKCWGYNVYGQLGDGTRTDRGAPTNVIAL